MTIKEIVRNELCTGCGVCISEDKSNSSEMIWNSQGFLVPQLSNSSDEKSMERVCPFSLNGQYNEDTLAKLFFKNAPHQDSDIGFYSNLYFGFSKEHRATSSSGGMATFLFEQILLLNQADHLFIVKEIDGKYGYQLHSSVDSIKEISKTRYYPVTLESLFSEIDNIKGTIAISGVACFIKAIRLKQVYNQELRDKITFLVGIICGGLKSKYYTDFLAQSSGCFDDYSNAEYRVKKPESYALDYKFTCKEKYGERIHVVEMRKMGDMWGTGLFKSNACDFCDDVTTELADISLGDAWIEPYSSDGMGNSVVIARSALADDIVKKGIAYGSLNLVHASLEQVKSSQQGSFNHRHKGLLFRIKDAESRGRLYPIKRARFLSKQSILFNEIQRLRMKTRENSLALWVNTQNVDEFNDSFTPYLNKLKRVTKFQKIVLKVNRKIKKLRGVK